MKVEVLLLVIFFAAVITGARLVSARLATLAYLGALATSIWLGAQLGDPIEERLAFAWFCWVAGIYTREFWDRLACR